MNLLSTYNLLSLHSIPQFCVRVCVSLFTLLFLHLFVRAIKHNIKYLFIVFIGSIPMQWVQHNNCESHTFLLRLLSVAKICVFGSLIVFVYELLSNKSNRITSTTLIAHSHCKLAVLIRRRRWKMAHFTVFRMQHKWEKSIKSLELLMMVLPSHVIWTNLCPLSSGLRSRTHIFLLTNSIRVRLKWPQHTHKKCMTYVLK